MSLQDPFAHFRRRDQRRWCVRALATCAGVMVAVSVLGGTVVNAFSGMDWLGQTHETLPLPQTQAQTQTQATVLSGDAPAEESGVLAAGPAAASATSVNDMSAGGSAAESGAGSLPPQTPAAPEGASYEITISTSGFQAEVDRCVWVRMDLGAAAPIVGAHNRCGGDIVLSMQPGDVVTLRGEGLNSRYLVTDSRDARPGDVAADATAGMVAAVILQTCYWHNDQVRLVGMLRIDEGSAS